MAHLVVNELVGKQVDKAVTFPCFKRWLNKNAYLFVAFVDILWQVIVVVLLVSLRAPLTRGGACGHVRATRWGSQNAR